MKKYISILVASIFVIGAISLTFTSCEKETPNQQSVLVPQPQMSPIYNCSACSHYHGTLAGFPTPPPQSSLIRCCVCSHGWALRVPLGDTAYLYLSIEGAAVAYTNMDYPEVDPYIFYTDEDGHWDEVNVTDGRYEVVMSKDGYVTSEPVEVEVVDGNSTTPISIQLQEE